MVETAWHAHAVTKEAGYHDKLLKEAGLPVGPSRWWAMGCRDFVTISRDPRAARHALEILGETLHEISCLPTEARILAGTLELQVVARMALRLGAWKLVALAMGAQLFLLRSGLPTRHRMSRATGLVAEWALCRGVPDTALVYARESLAWGAEPHRIRSYLAYAETLAGLLSPDGPNETTRTTLPLMLSREAMAHQQPLANRRAFVGLHEFRIALLANTGAKQPSPPKSSDPAWQVVDALQVLAWTTVFPEDEAGGKSRLPGAVEFLLSTGRWRDLAFADQARTEKSHPRLPDSASDFVTGVDVLADSFLEAFERPGPVDSAHLDGLEASIFPSNPTGATISLLCCI